MHPELPQAQVDHVARQLKAVAERLCREFAPAGGAAAAEIRAQVREARHEFGSPPVVAYLPVLVERTVRRRLLARTSGGSPAPHPTPDRGVL